MSGRFFSGQKPNSRGSVTGGGSRRAPTKRQASQHQPFQPLPMEPGGFSLYGEMEDTCSPSVPAIMPQVKVSPRRPPGRVATRGVNKPAMPGKTTPGKPLRSLEKTGIKAKRLPSAKQVLPDIASQYDRMLTGYLDNLPTPQSSTIRIFLSSTFSDFKTERNFLIKNAYPVLRQHCEDKGLEFQVVDLRWGITDSSSNDHTVEALCLREIANCQRLSPGCNFVTMLGNRYGFRPIPTSIAVSEFETICRLAHDASIINKWYRKDENAQPPAFILQDITTHIPEFGNTDDEEKRKEASGAWNVTMTTLAETLREAVIRAHAQGEMSDNRLHDYHLSVTEQEIDKALLTVPFPEVSCVAFSRHLDDVDLTHKFAKRFREVTKSGEALVPATDVDDLMTSLKSRITDKLPSDNCHAYNIPWREEGVLADDPAHVTYLTTFSNDFVTSVRRLIDEQVARDTAQRQKQVTHSVTIPKPATPDAKPLKAGGKGKGRVKASAAFGAMFGENPAIKADMMRGVMAVKGLVEEHQMMEKNDGLYTTDAMLKVKLHADILHHLLFCGRRCAVFCGRRDELAHVKKFVTSLTKESPPLVVTSPSGGGKTSFMAKVAEQTKRWLGEQAVVLVRFLGTSPQSSSLLPLMEGLCSHISLAYGETLHHNALNHIGAAQKYFLDLVNLVSLAHGQRRPLVILLDSVEGLSHSNRPHLLHWLPKHVPTHVKIIISMTPEINNSLVHARAHLQTNDTFLNLHLQPLPARDANELIKLYPQQYKRVLTEKQYNKLSLQAENLPPSILLKLWVDEACLWKSYITELKLPGTITEAIEMIFNRLEQKFGKVFVSAALGYLTLCQNGISEIELEDVLSVNDEVLNEVYRYHNPPLDGIVRIPAMMWTRMRHDLHEYLMQNQTPDRTIMSWYYKQFGKVAIDRYIKGPAGQKLHGDLAKIFLVEDKLCSTIHLEQRKLTIPDADRLITPQKLKPTNVRKLLCVTHHLSGSGDLEKLKDQVVCNLRFIDCVYRGIFRKQHQAHATSHMWQLLQDSDEESRLVVSALRLANPLIIANLEVLPVQLLNRLVPYKHHYKNIALLCKQAEDTIRAPGIKALLPIVGSVQDCSCPVNWYFEGPTRIINQSQDGSLLLVGYGSRHKGAPLCRLFSVNSCQVTHTIPKSKALANDILYSGMLSRNNRRVYLLCKNNYVVFTLLGQSGSRVQAVSNNVNGAGSLNTTMAASSNDKMLVLAGPARLAMFEDVGDTFDQPEFQVRHAMNFSGATATTNIMFTDDETGSITSHTIQGQKRVIGAISRWTFNSQDPCNKVPLPEPIPPGCLVRLPGQVQPDCVLVACADGKLYTICMSSSSILQEIKNSVGLRGMGLLLALHNDSKLAALASKEAKAVALFDLTEEKMTGHCELGQNAQVLRLGPDESHMTVLRRDGVLKLFEINDLQEKASIVAHDADSTSLFCPDNGHILTCAYDRNLKQFELSKLLKNTGRCSAISEVEAQKMIEYDSLDSYCIIDESTILTGHKDTSPSVWEISSGQKLQQLEPTNVGSMNIAVVANGTRILSHDKPSKTVKQWEWPSTKPVKLLSAVKNVILMQASEDGEKIVFACESIPGSMILVYNVLQNEETSRIFITEKILRTAQSFLTKNSQHLVLLLSKAEKDEDGDERLVLGAIAIDLTKPGDQDTSWLDFNIKIMTAFNSDLFALADEGEVVVWLPPKSVGLWDMKKYGGWLKHSQAMSASKKGLKNPDDIMVTQVIASSDNRMLVTVGEDGMMVLWWNITREDLVNCSTGIILNKHTNSVTSLRFSQDSKHLVSGSADKTIILWDVPSGIAVVQMHMHARVTDLDFLPGGQRIIARLKGAISSRLGVWELIG